MIESLGLEVIIPTYQAFRDEAELLSEVAESFCDNPTSSRLADLQEQWMKARALWKQTDSLNFGPYSDQPWRLGPKIDFWPVREDTMAENQSIEEPLTYELVSTLGASSRGIATMEFMIFDPNGDFDDLPSFERREVTFQGDVSDGQGGTDTATVNVTVAPVNDPPVATNDPVETTEDQSVTFDPRGNDNDIDGDLLTVTTTTNPANGSVAINGDGTLTYTPNADFNGDDSWQLPIPATYVVDPQGIIRYRHIDADYSSRAEPETVIEHL